MTTMDFFGHQERARRASKWLILWFALAVLSIISCLYVVAMLTLHYVEKGGSIWRLDAFLIVAGGTLAVILSATLFKVAQLRSGGVRVAQLLGGRPIELETTDTKERMFRNIVEEMAIASGTPVPAIYVLDNEKAINAFAAGWSPADAVIAVTRGCLEQLDRDELQGVVAHEFSHIFHGDMRLNIRIMGVLFGIVCIATMGRIVVHAAGRGASRDKKGGAAGLVIFGIAVMVIGGLGVLFARLIQAAVSRQREFLADASAVQYTRNPRGIGMALAKIGGLGGKLVSAQTESASHMLFANGMSRFLGGAMATHPPVAERVERILPGFQRHLATSDSFTAAAMATPAPAMAGVAALAAGVAPRARVDSNSMIAQIGEVQPAQIEAARTLLREIPLDLTSAARDRTRARALALALLLDASPAERRRQLAGLMAREPQLAHDVTATWDSLSQCGRHMRLPLLELAIATLRTLSSADIRQLRTDARQLALADGSLSPFEFALLRSLERHLRLPDDLPERPHGRPDALLQHPRDIAVVLSALARVGSDGEAESQAAFARGAKAIAAGIAIALLPETDARIEDLDRAVTALHHVSALGKRNLLLACAEVAGSDGTLDADESDLLRALAELWDCPIPLVTSAQGVPLSPNPT